MRAVYLALGHAAAPGVRLCWTGRDAPGSCLGGGADHVQAPSRRVGLAFNPRQPVPVAPLDIGRDSGHGSRELWHTNSAFCGGTSIGDSMSQRCLKPTSEDSVFRSDVGHAQTVVARSHWRTMLRTVSATLRLWRHRHGMRAEMARFDAATLGELGISVGLVEYEIRQPFWRPLRSWRD